MKIVITDHRFPHIEHERRAVADAGWDLVVGQAASEEDLIALCCDADGVLAGRAQITEAVLAAMQRCRIIVRYGIGVETIDIDSATKHHIMVANVPDYCTDEVSDHTLTLLLMLSRQVMPAVSIATGETWSVAGIPPLHRLRGQTCGLFGFGRIGSLLARKLSALGVRSPPSTISGKPVARSVPSSAATSAEEPRTRSTTTSASPSTSSIG